MVLLVEKVDNLRFGETSGADRTSNGMARLADAWYLTKSEPMSCDGCDGLQVDAFAPPD